jgi:hypothetical protein
MKAILINPSKQETTDIEIKNIHSIYDILDQDYVELSIQKNSKKQIMIYHPDNQNFKYGWQTKEFGIILGSSIVLLDQKSNTDEFKREITYLGA